MVETQKAKGEFSPEEREEIGRAVKTIVKFDPETIKDVLDDLSQTKNKLAIACNKILDSNPPTEKLIQEMKEMSHEIAIVEEVISQTKIARQLLGKDEYYNAMLEHGFINQDEK